MSSISLLLIDSASRLSALLDADATARGYRLTSVGCLEEALAAAAREPFHAALIDLESGPEPGLDALFRLKALSPDLEIIMLAAGKSLAAAIRSYELAAFAFVPKPVESAQLVATIDRVRLHQAVRRGKSEWERTFDAIGEPIAVFNRYGRLLRGNVALAAFLGRPVTELPHTRCCEVGFCGGGCPACAVGQALLRDTSAAAEITLPSGRIFTVTTFPVGGADDASVVQVAKDVTEQIQSARQLQRMSDELASTNAQLMATVQQLKSTQAQLLQAEKLSAIGQLVAGVAHELNNPLTSVIGYAQLLEQELLETDEEVRVPAQVSKDLRRIAEESERAARIVRNLLAFARRQSAARVPQDVADLISRVLTLRNYDLRLNDVELVTQFEPGLPQVVADGGQLQQALLNLILNGEQAMRNRPSRRLTVGARLDRPADAVEVFVSDTGHGIDPANLSRIFDPFFTTREVGEGTGLGLSICYGILRDHGGEISVDSRVQVGTTFSVRLPARTAGSVIESGDILVAHPDQGERDFLAAALAGWGYNVVRVSRPEETLERYVCSRLSLALVERSLLRASAEGWAMVARRPGAPVVLLAPAGNDDEIEGFIRERVHGVLATPFQLRSLRTTVRAIANEKKKECA